ncbi:hypothetical protein [Mesorhizobium sp. M7A.T.Ca.TU.009.02.1.1]|uniref:hypothetical protein n=1 Tax=Mesorhizobium sp. M7A.T.Ca.TU.009.02.1.1 TaxID=2496791 RepID=UPI0013E0438C|nr:hypothetical protein [Mesorhizobium sp. M7A.T.Ca.TU.009.02.1.1]
MTAANLVGISRHPMTVSIWSDVGSSAAAPNVNFSNSELRNPLAAAKAPPDGENV